jgi:hypothetical protein
MSLLELLELLGLLELLTSLSEFGYQTYLNGLALIGG